MAVAFVQSDTNQHWSGTTFTLAFGSDVTAGNLIVVAAYFLGTADTPTVADTLSNTYTLVGSILRRGVTTTASLGVWYAKNITGGTCTVTVSSVPSSFGCAVAHEISGCDTTAPLDLYASQTQTDQGTGTDAVTSTAITPSQAGCYLFGVTQNQNGAVDGIGTGWTDRASDTGIRTEDIYQEAAASKAATFTSIDGLADHLTWIVAFKVAGGAPPATVIPVVIHHRKMMGVV